MEGQDQNREDEAAYLVLDLTTSTVLGFTTVRDKALAMLEAKARQYPDQVFALARVDAVVRAVTKSEVH